MFENWVAANQGAPSQGAYEFPIITDAHIVGVVQEGFGPYIFLNPVDVRKGFRPAVVVRVEDHLIDDPKKYAAAMERTDEEWYHGGWLKEEITALLSLAMGVRGKPGGVTRRFDPGQDPRGSPSGWASEQDPIPLVSPRRRLPRVTGNHALTEVLQLSDIPNARPEAAITLVRAARLYQDAVWIADTEPNLGWLLLISAVEVAAGFWRQARDAPVERMRVSRPDLEKLLIEAGGEALRDKVADQVAPYMGATKTFVDFLLEFLPEPPPVRPTGAGQLPWEKATLKKVFTIVYKYRSRAVHSGTPFPFPMCDGPMTVNGWAAPAEIPLGLATRTLGATWLRKDTPILLSTFEFIARGALLRFWREYLVAA